MPAYDFKCPNGHVTEKFMSSARLAEIGEKAPCDEKLEDGSFCSKVGEYCPSFWYNSATNAQRFSPVVIHRDVNGKIRFPAHANAPVPEGFQRVELATIPEIRALEREVNAQDRIKDQSFQDARNKFLDGQLAENRRSVAAQVAGFSPRGKWFYDAIRRVSEKKRLAGRSSSKPEFYVEAFSQDASNREGYADRANDYGKMQRSGK